MFKKGKLFVCVMVIAVTVFFLSIFTGKTSLALIDNNFGANIL